MAYRSPYSARRKTLITLTVMVWVSVLLASSWRFKLAARAVVTINLTTKPSAVRITLDSEPQNGGNYLETPSKLTVTPGRHKIKISRDGYIAHAISVEGGGGESYRMDDVVLQKNPAAEFTNVDIVDLLAPLDPESGMLEPGAAYVDIDDGLAKGELPLPSTEITLNVPHVLTVYPAWPDKAAHFRCRFTAAPTADDSNYHIKLRIKNARVKATGCERLKDGGK